MLKNARGQRGKVAEEEVEKLFKRWNSRMDFAWHQLPDSRSSRGTVPAQPSDYLVVVAGTTIFLEVKETGHDFRISKDKVSQLPTLKKFQLAGATGLVLILHTGLEKWRVVNINDLKIGLPSWNLTDYPLYDSASEALLSVGVF